MKLFVLTLTVILTLSAVACDKPNNCVEVEHSFRDYWGPGPNDFDTVTIYIEDCL